MSSIVYLPAELLCRVALERDSTEGVAGEHQDGWQLSWFASGERIASKATICATGVEYSRLGLERENDFLNRGLYYGAGSSEAGICKGRVVIVGGGNSAGQAALNFARQTQVTMLVRGECPKDALSTYLLERIEDTSSYGADEDYADRTQRGRCVGESYVSQ